MVQPALHFRVVDLDGERLLVGHARLVEAVHFSERVPLQDESSDIPRTDLDELLRGVERLGQVAFLQMQLRPLEERAGIVPFYRKDCVQSNYRLLLLPEAPEYAGHPCQRSRVRRFVSEYLLV